MSYNGSGSFTINSSGQPVVAATLIDATVFNALTADLASGLSNAICKDGQTTVTADIPLNNHKLTGVAAATARTDAATLATIQDGTGRYVATVGGTADVITLTPSPAIAAYVAGQRFQFKASGANTTNVTVAISGLSAQAVTKDGTTALVANDIASGAMVTITYDGTRFILGTVASNRFLPLTGGTLTGGLVGTTGTFSGLMDLSGASAGQISFPATQNASTGANTLDDYEEGGWTPLVGGTATYTSTSSTYTKIGRLIHVHGELGINTIGTGNNNTMTGLPYICDKFSVGTLHWTTGALSLVYGIVVVQSGTTTVQLQGLTAAGATVGTVGLLGNGTTVRFMITYETGT